MAFSFGGGGGSGNGSNPSVQDTQLGGGVPWGSKPSGAWGDGGGFSQGGFNVNQVMPGARPYYTGSTASDGPTIPGSPAGPGGLPTSPTIPPMQQAMQYGGVAPPPLPADHPARMIGPTGNTPNDRLLEFNRQVQNSLPVQQPQAPRPQSVPDTYLQMPANYGTGPVERVEDRAALFAANPSLGIPGMGRQFSPQQVMPGRAPNPLAQQFSQQPSTNIWQQMKMARG